MSAPEGKRSRSWFSIIMMVFLCILWSVPTLGLLISSFRPRIEIERSGWWTALFNPFSSDWTFNNYSTVLTEGEMDLAFINSIVVAIPATILPIMFAAFAAYAFTFMKFWGRDILFIVVVSMLVVPNFVSFVPMLRLYRDYTPFGGEFPAVWLFHVGFGMSPDACAEFDFVRKRCDLWFSADFPPSQAMVEHERLHCQGYDHLGMRTMAGILERYQGQSASAGASR